MFSKNYVKELKPLNLVSKNGEIIKNKNIIKLLFLISALFYLIISHNEINIQNFQTNSSGSNNNSTNNTD